MRGDLGGKGTRRGRAWSRPRLALCVLGGTRACEQRRGMRHLGFSRISLIALGRS